MTTDAITMCQRWLSANASNVHAAFIGGSMGAGGTPGAGQDIDLYLVVERAEPGSKIGKIPYADTVLDVSWLEREPFGASLNSHDAVLTSLLNFGRIVLDDSGDLTALQGRVRSGFRDPTSVRMRTANMLSRIEQGLARDSSEFHPAEQLMNWLFPATLSTHIPLVMSCSPLTVRKRFVAARSVMTAIDYAALLSLFNFDQITAEQMHEWLATTADLFDTCTPLAETSFRFWAGDLKAISRPISINGSRRLIEFGDYREAAWWLLATSARSVVLQDDAGMDTSESWRRVQDMAALVGLSTAEERATVTTRILEWSRTYAGFTHDPY